MQDILAKYKYQGKLENQIPIEHNGGHLHDTQNAALQAKLRQKEA